MSRFNRLNWLTERRVSDMVTTQSGKRNRGSARRNNDTDDLSGPGAYAVSVIPREDEEAEATRDPQTNISERMEETANLETAQGEKAQTLTCQGHWVLPILLLFAIALTGGVLSARGGSNTDDMDLPQDPCELPVLPADPFIQCECQQEITEISEKIRESHDALVASTLSDRIASDIDIHSCDPQNKALLWTALDISHGRASLRIDDLINRFVLALIYASLGGEQWKEKSGWLSHKVSVCSWYGVECDKGYITALSLEENNLHGSLDSSIALLPALQKLTLAYNSITGTIPEAIWGMPSLEDIALENNKFDGTIPSQIADYSPKLKRLNVAYNPLYGTLPDITGFTNLVQLDLSTTLFEGTFPTENLENLSNLEELYLVHAVDLSGTLPSSIGMLTNLRHLRVSASISGTIPESIGNLTQLESLQLLSRDLRGTIPNTVGQMTNLDWLFLGESLTGTIPRSLGLLTNMHYIRILENCLVGSIPTELAALSRLESFYIGGNQMITGTLPLGFESFPNLVFLDIACTQIGGPMRKGLCNKPATIYVDSSQLNLTECPCCTDKHGGCSTLHANCTAYEPTMGGNYGH